MAEIAFIIAVGVKASVFLALLVYSFLINMMPRGRKIRGINVLAASFAVTTLFELVMAIGEGPVIPAHLLDRLHVFSEIFTLVGGLGLVWFLWDVNKNIKDYR